MDREDVSQLGVLGCGGPLGALSHFAAMVGAHAAYRNLSAPLTVSVQQVATA